MAPLLLLVPIALGGPAVLVEGAADCPSPAAVSSELARIMKVPEIEGPADVIQVSSSATEVTVSLRTAENAVLGERRVTAEGTCEERARAAAVIVAAWLTDIHPEYRNTLPDDAVPGPVPDAEPPTPPAPALPPAKPAPEAATPPASSPAARRLSIAVGAGVELSNAGVTPAFELSSRFAFDETGLGAFAFVLFALPVEREVGVGSVLSFRWPFGIGPLYRIRAGALLVDLAAAPTLGWLHVEGEGFATNEFDNGVVFGAFGGARVQTSWAPLRPFASAGLVGWFTQSTAVAHLPDDEVALPAVEGVALLGVSFEL